MYKYALVAIATTLCARSLTDKVDELYKQMDQIRTINHRGQGIANFANGSPEIDNWGVYFVTDILAWQAGVGGTESGFTTKRDSSQVTAGEYLPLDGKTLTIDFPFELGFRMGLGVRTKKDQFYTALIYTRFVTSGRESRNGTADLMTIGMRFVEELGINSNSSVHLSYQALDAWLGKKQFVSKDLRLDPKVGARAVWLNYKQNTRFDTNGPGPTDQDGTTIVDAQWAVETSHNTMIGPQVGLGADYFLARGYSFNVNFQTGLLFGYMRPRFRNTENLSITTNVETTSATNYNGVNLKANTHRVLPYLGLSAGIEKFITFERYKPTLTFAASYELEYYWRQTATPYLRSANTQTLTLSESARTRFDTIRRDEDIAFHGLTFHARLDF